MIEKVEHKWILEDDLYLHYDAKGFYSIKNSSEMAAYEKSFAEQHNSSVIKQKNFSKDEILFVLLDKYFYSLTRHKSYQRDKAHGIEDKHSTALYIKSEKNIQIIKEAIYKIKPDLKNKSDEQLKHQLITQEKEQGRHYGDDLSDNSDNEDDESLRIGIDNPRTQRLRNIKKILDKFDNEALHTKDQAIKMAIKNAKKHRQGSKVRTKKEKQVNDIKSKKVDSYNVFSIKTRRTTPESAGLVDKIDPSLEKNLDKKIDEGMKALKSEDLARSTLDNLTSEQKKDLETINNLIKEGKLTQDTLPSTTQFYIADYRGLNYMLDRWNADSRRYHRTIDEEKLPQYSEMVLRASLDYCFYSELNGTNDYTKGEYKDKLKETGLEIRDFLLSLRNKGSCVDYTDKAKQNLYVFNNPLEQFQHHFSNGINEFLQNLQKRRTYYPEYWGKNLPNAHNPAVATGERPSHALKYAYGLKEYYKHSLLPRYHVDGTIEYCHAGKVYASLGSLNEFFSESQPNRVPQLNKSGRLAIKNLVEPEKETAYWGLLPADKVFYQYVVKYPSFKGSYKTIHAIKYGFNQELYESFQWLIQNTRPGTIERDKVVTLLSEWLCSYHEVLLIRKAIEEAKRKGGVLVYIDNDGLLKLSADKGLFTGGEENLPTRNTIHILRNFRHRLAEKITEAKEPMDEKSCQGFKLVSPQVINAVAQNISNSAESLLDLATDEGIKFSREEEAILGNFQGNERTNQENKNRIKKASDVIGPIVEGRNKSLFNSGPNPVLFTTTEEKRAKFENNVNVQQALLLHTTDSKKESMEDMLICEQANIDPVRSSIPNTALSLFNDKTLATYNSKKRKLGEVSSLHPSEVVNVEPAKKKQKFQPEINQVFKWGGDVEPPTKTDLDFQTVILQEKNKFLSAYWLQDNKVVCKSLPVQIIKDNKKISRFSEKTTAADIIKEVRKYYGCNPTSQGTLTDFFKRKGSSENSFAAVMEKITEHKSGCNL